MLQGAALAFGRGRVAVFGEAAMFSAQVSGPERRRQISGRPSEGHVIGDEKQRAAAGHPLTYGVNLISLKRRWRWQRPIAALVPRRRGVGRPVFEGETVSHVLAAVSDKGPTFIFNFFDELRRIAPVAHK